MPITFHLQPWLGHFSPIALVFATALVVLILYGCEFKSDVPGVLKDET
jgi:hypothetical protein